MAMADRPAGNPPGNYSGEPLATDGDPGKSNVEYDLKKPGNAGGKHGGFLFFSLLAGSLPIVVPALLLPSHHGWSGLAGSLLALASTGVHWIVLYRSRNLEDGAFLSLFFRLTFVRLILTPALFAALLVVTKSEGISFTLGFIISYILYSVIEMIGISRTYTSSST